MGINPGNIAFSMPPAEDDQVRKQRDLERTVRENAAARTAEATQIGKGGILVKDGGSIKVLYPGTIDLDGGSFTASTLAATTSITAGTTVTAGGTVQGAALVSTGGASVAGNSTVGGSETVTGPIYSPHGRATPITSGYVGAWLNADGRIGATASSVVYKQDFEVADAGALIDALLKVSLVRFRYIEAVKELGDDAVSELGGIAEYFASNGLGEYVYANADGDPMGINYERLTIPLIAVVQSLDARLKALGG